MAAIADTRPTVALVLGPSTGGIRRHVGCLANHLPKLGWDVRVLGPAGVMDGVGPQHGVIDIPSGLSPPHLLRARAALRVAVADADLVHAHGLKPGWLAATLRPRPPLVVTVHNLVLDEAAGRSAAVLRILERRLPGRADRTVAVSRDIAEYFRGRRGAERLSVIAPASPERLPARHRDDVRAEFGLRSDQPLVVTVARLHPQKDLETLLRALASLRLHHPDLGALVVGDGPRRDELVALGRELGLDGTVAFTGYRDDAVDLVAAADVFALSSRWEGSPVTIAEAMRLGRPVVATAVGAIPELVEDGVTGRLVPPGRPDQLAGALAVTLADPAEAAALGRAGAERAAELLGTEALVSQVERLYRATLNDE